VSIEKINEGELRASLQALNHRLLELRERTSELDSKIMSVRTQIQETGKQLQGLRASGR
jgi:uncharacterized coiled-coil DUF342 family protein